LQRVLGDHVPTVFDNYTATAIYKEHAIRSKY